MQAREKKKDKTTLFIALIVLFKSDCKEVGNRVSSFEIVVGEPLPEQAARPLSSFTCHCAGANGGGRNGRYSRRAQTLSTKPCLWVKERKIYQHSAYIM